MKKDILKAQIIETIEAITEQTQIISKHRGEIPQIEIDLVKKNILELYQIFHFLDKINNVNISKIIKDINSAESSLKRIDTKELEKEEQTAPLKAEENVQEEVAEVKNNEETTSTKEKSAAKSVIKETTDTPIIEEEVIPKKETTEIEKENKTEGFAPSLFDEPEETSPRKTKNSKITQEQKKETQTTNSQTTLSDKFKTEKKSIHDTIEQSGDTSIASRLQKAPIHDLVKAIGLNDRFFLTKELFKNDSEKYTESIKILNEMPDLDEAFDYLDDLKLKLEWDESSSAFLKIYDLTRRKHQNKK